MLKSFTINANSRVAWILGVPVTVQIKLEPVFKVCFTMHEIWLDDSQENHLNCCHQMSHFKAKMHQI